MKNRSLYFLSLKQFSQGISICRTCLIPRQPHTKKPTTEVFMYLISEMEKYVWKAIEKLNGLQLIFLMRDIMVRFPSTVKHTLSRNSKLKRGGHRKVN